MVSCATRNVPYAKYPYTTLIGRATDMARTSTYSTIRGIILDCVSEIEAFLHYMQRIGSRGLNKNYVRKPTE